MPTLSTGGEGLRLSTVLRLVRRRRRLLLALGIVGAVAGLAAALILPRSYESRSQVVLQGPREATEVATQAQVAMSLAVLDQAATKLDWKTSGPALQSSVTAAVTGGNVVGITARASDPRRAQKLAEEVTNAYIAYATDLLTRSAEATKIVLQQQQQTVQKRVDELNQRIGELQQSFNLLDPNVPAGAGTRAELQQLRVDRADAETTLSTLDQQIGNADLVASVGKSNMRVIEAAVRPSSSLPPTPLEWVAGGALLGFALGVVGLVTRRLNDRRLRRHADIAAALGAPVLGVVEAAGLRAGRAPGQGAGPHGWRARAAGFLRAEEPGSFDPEDELLEDLRYQRAFGRLVDGLERPAEVLVVVLRGDDVAARAVARWTVAGAERPALLVVGPGAVAAATEELARARGLSPDLLRVVPDGDADADALGMATVLRVQTLSGARPVLPRAPAAHRAVVVASVGGATGPELFGVAEACREAGTPLNWVLIVADGDEEGTELGPAPEQEAAPDRAASELVHAAGVTERSGGDPSDG